jgi:DhnA family fructose-bisphosphate aldolase class Ia
VPVIVLGASKENEAAALRKAAVGIAAGARGVVFGRNVFESERPQAFLDALGAVVRSGETPEVAAQKHGFGA